MARYRSFPTAGFALSLSWMITVAWPALATDDSRRGVVVESVSEDSTLAMAGVRSGDVFIAWRRPPDPPASAAEGALEGYFDWWRLRREEAPRGSVVLIGERGGERLAVVVERGSWKSTVRPVLPLAVLTQLSAGQEKISGGDLEAGIRIWRRAAAQLPAVDRRRAWVFYRIGDAWKNAHDRDAALAAYHEGLATAREAFDRAVLWHAIGAIQRRRGDFEASTQAHRAALEILADAGHGPLARAWSLNDLAAVTDDRGDPERAIELYAESITLRQEHAPGSLEVAESLNNLGITHAVRGEFELAEGYLRRALELKERLVPGTLHLASTLMNLGGVASERGDPTTAETFFRQALAIEQQRAPGSARLAGTLGNLGVLAAELSRFEEAEGLYLEALAILREKAPDSFEYANALNNLGTLAKRRGDPDLAEDRIRQAMAVLEARNARRSMAYLSYLFNLGAVAEARRELDLAEELYLRVIALLEGEARSDLMARAFGNLGVVAALRGDEELAEQRFRRSLAIKEEKSPGSLTLAHTLNDLGHTLRSQGRPEAAEKLYRRALGVVEEVAPNSLDLANVRLELGRLARRQGRLEDAGRHLAQALELRRRLAPGSLSEASAWREMGLLLGARGELAPAADHLVRALDILEVQIGRLGSSQRVRGGFRAASRDFYRDAVDALLDLDLGEAAFHVLERYRARSLLELLAEKELLTTELPAELVVRRRQLARRQDEILRQMGELDADADADAVAEQGRALQALAREREALAAEVRAASPRLAALQQPQPLDLAEARDGLDRGTVMLSYSVGRTSSDLFAVTRERFSVTRLELGDAELRDQVERLRQLIGEAPPASGLAGLRQSSLRRFAAGLYGRLMGPVDGLLTEAERLVIVPDGPLHRLPFGALVRTAGGNDTYLAAWKPLHSVLSATLYAELRSSRRPQLDMAATRVAAFGDPSYPPRVAPGEAASLAEERLRAVARRGLFDYPPLPASRREVEAIADLFPQARIFVGESASEERAKSLGSDVRIVHFAAHGYTDDRFPQSSALALTIPQPASPERDNGLLQVWEIMEQMRLDADLVVLSACSTGLGRESGGEGLVGLTRAFQYAGARSVLASLWEVADRSTAELMARFYRHLRRGRAMDEALRAAKLELIEGPLSAVDETGAATEIDAAAPFFWAAFQLYGDWR